MVLLIIDQGKQLTIEALTKVKLVKRRLPTLLGTDYPNYECDQPIYSTARPDGVLMQPLVATQVNDSNKKSVLFFYENLHTANFCILIKT